MPQQARVTSIDALNDFRARLIVFVEKASVAVPDALDDVSRPRLWLQSEQPSHWETQLRRRARDLETTEQELFSARIRNLREATNTKQFAVRKAKLALEEAQNKMALLKKWNRHYDGEVAPLVAQVEKLRGILSGDLRQAVAFLGRSVATLDAYSDRLGSHVETSANRAEDETALDPQSASVINPVGQTGKKEGSA